jgi:hypothetical protein
MIERVNKMFVVFAASFPVDGEPGGALFARVSMLKASEVSV